MQNKKPNPVFVYAAILIAFVLIIGTVVSPFEKESIYSYSEIIGFFQRGEVQKYVLDEEKREVTITEKDGKPVNIVYKIPNFNIFVNDIHNDVVQHNLDNPSSPITFDIKGIKPETLLGVMLPSLLLMGGFLLIMMFVMRQMGGSGIGNTFGKAKVKVGNQGAKVTFDDVAGAEEEKEELVEIVEFLKNPAKFNALGARIPKGVLLVGPPGTGKTLLARSVAGEAGVEFFSIAGSDFVEMFVGVGASRVRDLFEQAKKKAPSVVFIDEIDAVGRQRGAGLGGGHDEREQTLNQLLVEMDGFSTNTGVIVLAATNRADILDPALLRPGRFDRQVSVGYPDVKGREEILKVHSRNKPLAPDVDLGVVAKTTGGFTGADLENLLNESALLAAKRNKKAITMQEISESTIKVVMGVEKVSKVVTPEDRKLTAYHEAGHAVAAYYLPTQHDVHQVSIIPRGGGAGGYTMYLPEKDRGYDRKKEMEERLITILGGRVAEQIIFDDITTGAYSDLQSASTLTRNMITKFGFNDKIGPVFYGKDSSEVFLGRDYTSSDQISPEYAAKIDREMHATLTKAYDLSNTLLIKHVDKLHLVAKALLEHEKIEGDEFKELMNTGDMKSKPLSKDTDEVDSPVNTDVVDSPTNTEEAPIEQ